MRKLAIGVIGAFLLVLGTILLFIPGPGLLLIGLGLATLALEFEWAKKLLVKGKQVFSRSKDAEFEKRDSRGEKER